MNRKVEVYRFCLHFVVKEVAKYFYWDYNEASREVLRHFFCRKLPKDLKKTLTKRSTERLGSDEYSSRWEP